MALVVIPALAPLWMSHSRLTGSNIQSEPFAAIWIDLGHQAEGAGLCLLQERLHGSSSDPML